jgi:APA family basic amino acid/polyamine antiporter
MAQLRRSLNLAQVIFFGVGAILGAGIYTIIGKCAGFSGNMLWVSFLIATVTALMTAFSYAELAAMFPKAGGEFVYLHEAAGKRLAYFTGFLVALSGVISAATIALGFGGYFSGLLEVPPVLAALGIIILMLVMNIIGIREATVLTIVFTLIEAAGLVYVVIAAVPHIGTVNYLESPPEGMTGIFLGAALSFFAFKGVENIVKLSEETKNPEKNIPRAIFLSSGIVLLLYMLVVFTAVSAVPFEELARSESPLSDIAEKRFGHTGALLIAIVALFSTSNTLLSGMVGSSRVLYSMSEESKRFKIFSRVSGKGKTPVAALLLCAVLAGVFALIGDLKSVALITNFLVFVTAILVNVAVIILRRKKKSTERPYRIPVNIMNIPVSAVLGILFTIVLAVFTCIGLVQGQIGE